MGGVGVDGKGQILECFLKVPMCLVPYRWLSVLCKDFKYYLVICLGSCLTVYGDISFLFSALLRLIDK